MDFVEVPDKMKEKRDTCNYTEWQWQKKLWEGLCGEEIHIMGADLDGDNA